MEPTKSYCPTHHQPEINLNQPRLLTEVQIQELKDKTLVQPPKLAGQPPSDRQLNTVVKPKTQKPSYWDHFTDFNIPWYQRLAAGAALPLVPLALLTGCVDTRKPSHDEDEQVDGDPDEGVLENLPEQSITMERVNDAVLYYAQTYILISTTVSHQTPGEARGWIFSRY